YAAQSVLDVAEFKCPRCTRAVPGRGITGA
ncbi:MAG: hypothetical protein ACI9MR_003871, partial [Myxococcota bacterium]